VTAFAGVLIAASVIPALAQQQDPSWTDRMGDFFKRIVPGGSAPDQAQPQPQPQPQPTQAPAGQPPAAQTPAQAAPDSPAPASPRASRPEPSLTDRIGNFFNRLRPGADAPEPAPRGGTEEAATEEFDCPAIDIREGASTLMLQAPGEPSALSLRYQASFVRAARECIVKGQDVTIKVGVQGRIILGPAGGAGDVKIPLRYALVWEDLGHTKMIWSKLYVIPVSVGAQQANVDFKHVEDDMTIPIPKPSELENYMVYIGFDPNGIPPEPRKSPPPKAKPKKPGTN
jgi:hypothetical protein